MLRLLLLLSLAFNIALCGTFRFKVGDTHDPDDDVPTCQLATSKGYPCQQYNVTTEDGYILTVHRLPYGVKSPGNVQTSGKPVVYLQHGLLDCSATWVENFPTESLGFLLADAGYDVWLGNMRGNTYAMAHVEYTTKQSEFWEFTFDEMAKFDLPAIVEYALATSGQEKLYYVGHSQGTLIGFIKFSQDPTWTASKIKQFHALAPIVYLGHTTSPLKLIAPFSDEIGFLLELLGVDEFLPSTKFMQWLGENVCVPPMEFLCENVLMLIAGYDTKNMNATRNSVYMTHAPAGTSTYNIVHFGQLISSDKFQAMDWGYFDNEKKYGSHSPPEYFVETMTVPTAIYWGDIDEFADPTDVEKLQPEIQNLLGSYRYPDMDHLDFVWGLNAMNEPYPQLMQLIAADLSQEAKAKNALIIAFCELLTEAKLGETHDPDDGILTCQLATSKGYPCQQYNVTTEDGYILTVHRLPYGVKSPDNVQTSGKPVVYLQHGLLDCSATWVENFPTKSLGFLLADAGYDLWLGNMRGNTYGMAHVEYTTKQKEFWEFTFDEMAKFDLPAIVDLALATSGQESLYYVGHSQGTLIGFIKFSSDPTWAQSKIKQFHALAPIVYLGHTTSPLKLIAPLSDEVEILSNLLGAGEFLPSTTFTRWLGGNVCTFPTVLLCENVLMIIAGYDTKNMNTSRTSVYMTHVPAGTSTYNIVHFGQLIKCDKYQAMDWGYFDNEKKYGSHSPPQYNVKTMTVPTAIYWGDMDVFTNPIDVQKLQPEIQHLLGSYRYPDMDHLDFVWGLNAMKEPYPQLMQLIATDLSEAKKI